MPVRQGCGIGVVTSSLLISGSSTGQEKGVLSPYGRGDGIPDKILHSGQLLGDRPGLDRDFRPTAVQVTVIRLT
jgi:hypothetical protein